jgi:Uncharacterized protein conserved in bacteria
MLFFLKTDRMKTGFLFSLMFVILSCTQKQRVETFKTFDSSFLDSVRAKSDTCFTKHYRNTDFVTAEYFVNRKDSTVCQLMKDSAGHIRQILVAAKKRKIFGAEYYRNGQLVALLPFSANGKLDGASTYYYESGIIKSKGSYQDGFRVGRWNNYSAGGNLISTELYNENGVLVKTENK